MLGMSLSKGTLVFKTVYTNHLNSVTGADSPKAIRFGRNQPALIDKGWGQPDDPWKNLNSSS